MSLRTRHVAMQGTELTSHEIAKCLLKLPDCAVTCKGQFASSVIYYPIHDDDPAEIVIGMKDRVDPSEAK